MPTSLPNVITLGRILLVPIIIWAIASDQMALAFAVFVIAGVSDAVDGVEVSDVGVGL
jgi:cardiolipin synthase